MIPTRLEFTPTYSASGTASPNSSSFCRPLATRTISGTTYQVCGYSGGEERPYHNRYIILGYRTLPYGEWSWFVYNGQNGLPSMQTTVTDDHYSVAVGIDSDGYVHVCYDNRTSALKYRRSSAALGSWTGGLTAEQDFTGSNESFVNYGTFFTDPLGNLYSFYREGTSLDGDTYIYKYDTSTTTWSALAGTGTDGIVIFGDGDSEYLFGHPRFTSDWDGAGTGFMYVAFCWRTGPGLTNEDIIVLRWDGTDWETFGGSAQTMPVTYSNYTPQVAVATSEGMFNQSGFFLDGNDRPHVLVVKENGSGHYNVFDIYYNGSSWTTQQITSYATTTNNDYVDYGRPWGECDTTNNIAYIWFAHSTFETGIIQYASDAGDFSTWTKSTFHPDDLGNHEPVIDAEMWRDHQHVCMWCNTGNSAGTSERPAQIVTRKPKGISDAFSTSEWGRFHAITIDAAEVGTGGVNDFTVVLTRDHFDNEACDPSGGNAAQEDGGDLRFFTDSDLTTPLACNIIQFGHDSLTNAGDATIQIDVGPLDLSDSTDTTIYVAYKTTDDVSQPYIDEIGGSRSVYTTGWKMKMPLDLAAGNVIGDGFFIASMSSALPDSIATTLGKGIDLDGAGNVIRLPTGPLGISSEFAIAQWIDFDAFSSGEYSILGSDSGGSHRGAQFRLGNSGTVDMIRFDSSNNVVANFSGTTVLDGNGPARVVFRFGSSGSTITVNGATENTDSNTTAQHDDSGLQWTYGQRAGDQTSQRSIGSYDQLEIHTDERSDAWWETDYNNQSSPSTFASPGTPADVGGDTTAPILSSPTGTATGSTTADGSVSTDEENGTLYWIATTFNGTPSVAQIQAGANAIGAAADDAGSQAVSATGTQDVSIDTLSGSTTYYLYFQHQDAAGNDSAVVGTSFTTAAPAPVLSSPMGSATSSTTAGGNVTTDTAGGDLSWVVTQSATKPSAAQIEAGDDHTDSAAADFGAIMNVPAAGTASIDADGLQPSTAYYFHYVHRNASGDASAVVSSAQFTTDTALAPDGVSQGNTVDSPTLSQTFSVSPDGVTQAQSATEPTITQDQTVNSDSVVQVQFTGTVTLTQANTIAPAEVVQAQTVAQPNLTQAHVLVPDSAAQAQLIDAASLTQAGSIAAQAVAQGQTVGAATITQAHQLAVQSIVQAQTIDEALIAVAGVLSVEGITQAQILEALELVQAHVLAPNGITQAQELDATTVDATGLQVDPDAVQQQQTTDQAALTQYHVLSVDRLSQQQIIDIANFGGVVLGELEGRIVIYAALSGTVYTIPALTGTVQ